MSNPTAIAALVDAVKRGGAITVSPSEATITVESKDGLELKVRKVPLARLFVALAEVDDEGKAT